MRRAGTLPQAGLIGILVLLAAMMFFPFYFMLQISLKDDTQFAQQFWLPVPPFHWENYSNAFATIWHYIVNSIIVVGLSTVGVVLVATLAAYAFARLSFPGRETLYYVLISLMMIPSVLTLVPQFVLIKNFNLMGTFAALILPYIAVGEIISIFILRAFFSSLPEELFEAARIDGAADLQVFLRIAVPLVRPAVTAIAILQILTYWNDYVLPSLVLTDDSVKTLVLGLVAFQTRFAINYGPQMAGYTIGALPLLVLFSFGMRQFVSGLTAGALKL
jgi:ABC-type glycerol-3-phosphate transport system permease component